MNKTKIVIADDHGFVREGIKRLIEQEPEYQIVAEASDGEELLAKLDVSRCDLVVLDLSMPKLDGIEALKEIKRKYPKLKVLVLSMLKDYKHFEHAMANGASGFMAKDDACDQLNKAIRKIIEGKRFISPSVSILLEDRLVRSFDEVGGPSLEILTKREKEILKLIANGMASKNIALGLKISSRTVANHRANICDKLGFHTTAALVKYAMSKGLV
ncbi:MAG: response regulator transcription factor [Candidatus Omnitrophica bacterium]|nr:response regulator transcription factor [Candidatus Omnitrophota bacterium]